ncbi:hypothetical protein [Halolamina salina]|uniref:Uncharacterized protein n=1 Tax=Halolamina salina TaxID=1220023 RepID=A0ABD6B165_9EURY
MHPPTQTQEYPTHRRPPTFETTLLLAALPLAVMFAATFPTAAAGLFVGAAAGAALQR